MNSTLLVTVVEFIEKYSSEELVKLLKFNGNYAEMKEALSEKGINYKIITTIVSGTFEVSPLVIKDGGNNQAIYRNACYYFHQKYDPTYSLKKMVDLYGKLPNSVRNGLKNIENILHEPRINKAYYKALIKIDSRLSEIDLWQKHTESANASQSIKTQE